MSKAAADRLTMLALIAALAIVFARGATLEPMRLSGGAGFDPQASGGWPQATAGLMMDLIGAIPALVVLAKSVARPDDSRRSSLACILAAILGVWVLSSAIWAADKYSALIQAAHLLSAFSLLWAVSLCVTTPKRLKLVAAAAFGFLLLQVVNAAQWRFIEMPPTLEYFRQHKAEILKNNGWIAGDFLARQYENKLNSREMLGFTGSSNSFAAVLVLLMGASAGLSIQKFLDGMRASAIVVATGIPAGIWMLCYTQSKAAIATPLLVALLLLITWRNREFLRRRAKAAYWRGFSIVLALIAVILICGLATHRLPGASLNFRWRYWIASWQMFVDHPLLGVGWNNFGDYYLRYRLPQAAEEIIDPHNFLIRFATESGLIGASLAIAWMARLWWELTAAPQATASMSDNAGPNILAWAVLAGLAINIPASVDFSQNGAAVFVQLLNCFLLFAVLLIGAWAASRKVDDRPAPWVLYAILASLAAFFTHNLIEFSFFEPGPMFLVALLAGSALGMRRQKQKSTRPLSAVFLGLGALAWLVAAALLVIPIEQAQSLADQGDQEMRDKDFARAHDDYLHAFEWCGFNGDYPYRAAIAEAYRPGADLSVVREYLDTAIAVNPTGIRYYLSLGNLQTQLHDADGVRAAFGAALALNPNEVSIRLDFGDSLMRIGLPAEAAAQYELARKFNDLLPLEEPKRIDDSEIQKRLDAARNAQKTTAP